MGILCTVEHDAGYSLCTAGITGKQSLAVVEAVAANIPLLPRLEGF